MIEYAYLNGEIMPIENANLNITDLALLRGYGVFDFFKAIDGRPVFMEDHLNRFETSTWLLGLKIPYSREHLRKHILELVRLNYQSILGVKLVCTGGYSEDGYTPAAKPNLFMVAKPFKMHPYEKGLSLMTVEHQRELAEIKSINYAKPISVLAQLRSSEADDVLYVSNGLITESSRSNIFIIKNGVLITPDAGVLRGITRKRILQFAPKVMPVEVRPVALSEVLDADEVFMTGSTKRIARVISVDNKKFINSQLTRLLYDMLLNEEKYN
jgi:branched-chain amino acid aminotransferase